MAITRAQQAKQMLQDGGMLVKPGFGGTRQGYRGPGGYQGGRKDTAPGAAKAGSVERPGGGGGNNVTSGTLSDPKEKQDFFTQSYKEPGLFGFGGGYRDLNVASDTSQGFKRGIGSRILGGIFGAINPVLGFAFNTIASAPKTFQTFKKSPTLEAFRDNLRGYGRTRPKIFNNPNLDLMIDEEDNEYDFSDIKDQEAKVVGLALAQKQNLEKKKRMEDFGGPKFTTEDQNVLDKLYEMDASEETFYQPVQRVADGGRIGLMEGGIMNPNIIGGEYDFESARQMYGLGKLVKKVTRTVKKIAKSPIGKAALTAATIKFGGPLAAKVFPSTFGSAASSPFLRAIGRGQFFGDTGIFSAGKAALFGSNAVGPNVSEGILSKIGPLGAITAVSALAGLMTPEQEEEAQELARGEGIDIEAARRSILNAGTSKDQRALAFRAEGGPAEGKEPVAKKTMPLLDMGGKEMDLRAEGGFVPIGRMEKADDVPARLSKNEFVFTADAVRNAGDGDVDKGAEVMYNMMKNLESGGDVSEESQGLKGARRMFQTSQRLEEVL